MPRPLLSCRIDESLHNLLVETAQSSDRTITEITIAALQSYLLPQDEDSQMSDLMRRIERLEARVL
jgi:hypothetical protein